MQGVGIAIATTLFGALGVFGIISAGAVVALVGIVTVGVLTTYQIIRNEDGSVTFDMFVPNLSNLTCLTASVYLGQARNLGTFRTFFWPSSGPTMCF